MNKLIATGCLSHFSKNPCKGWSRCVDQPCRSCGASSLNTPNISFVCEYCGEKNVCDQYFIERAKNIDYSRDNRYMDLGLAAFNLGDYQLAGKQFERAVQEDDQSICGWLYLAQTEAKTVKPSNFINHILVAIDCIERAQKIDAKADIFQFGSTAIGNSFLSEAVGAARYYFDMAEKKLVLFGNGDSTEVLPEIQIGFSLMKDAFSLNPNDSRLIATSCIYALSKIFRFDDLRINSPQMKQDQSYFFDKLYGIFLKDKYIALEMLVTCIGLFDQFDLKIAAPTSHLLVPLKLTDQE